MENQNVEIKNVEVVEEEKESFGVKAKAFAKKHGKKIAVGTAVVAASLVGFMLGHRSSDEIPDEDYVTIDDEESEEETTEE